MKLIVLSGPLQGKILDLADGNNFVGRADENSIALPSGQVSRRHACISLVEGRIFLEDLGSSNGTFVDGQRIAQKVGLRPGSRFQVGEFLLELSVDGQIAQPAAGPPGLPAGAMPGPAPRGPAPGQAPVSLKGGQLMPMVVPADPHGGDSSFWQFYRAIGFLGWRGQMVLMALAATIVIVGIGIYPLLRAEQKTLTEEVLKRGAVLVNRLAIRNGEFVKNRQETNLDTAQILTEQGVTEAYLLNKKLAILSPVEQRGRMMNNQVSREALIKGDLVTAEDSDIRSEDGKSGVYHLAVPIRVWSGDRGIYESYGVAYIVISAREVAEVNAKSDVKFTTATIVVSLSMIGFVVILSLLTNRPIKALAEDADLVLRGDLRTVESRARWKELNSLAHSLNRSFDRYHSAAASSPSTAEAVGPSFMSTTPAPESSSVEDAKVRAIANAVAESVLITDEMQRVVYINRIAEQMFGTSLDRARQKHVMEVVVDQELLGHILDLFKQLMSSGESAVSVQTTITDRGRPREAAIVASGVKDSQGQLSYAAIVIR